MVNAGELLRGDAPFVADTSAWWRVASLTNELGALVSSAVLEERFWITPIVRSSQAPELRVPLTRSPTARAFRGLPDAAGRLAWIYRGAGPEDRPSVERLVSAVREAG